MEAFRPIRSDRLSDKAVQQILKLIRTGELPVGTRLPNESELAQRLGVSRGILREALTVLQTLGYISRAPREGTIVKRNSEDELGVGMTAQLRAAQYRELLEFRETMECKVVQNVIQRASEEDLENLQRLLDVEPDANLPDSPDFYFHFHLAELSGNSLFAAFINLYYDRIHEMAQVTHRNQMRQAEQDKEHRRILSAIRARNPRMAVAAVRGHLRNVQRAVESNNEM